MDDDDEILTEAQMRVRHPNLNPKLQMVLLDNGFYRRVPGGWQRYPDPPEAPVGSA